MPRRSVFLATPAYDGNVNACMALSLMHGARLLADHDYEVKWLAHIGSCYLPVARNKMVRAFLESGFTDMIMIDADVQFDPVGLLKLMAYDVDIVGGTYPYKQEEGGWPIWLKGDENGKPIVDPITYLVEANGIPTGFMRIRRHVFDVMKEKLGDEELLVDELNPDGTKKADGTYYNFFDTGKEKNLWWGEDYAFCKRWRALGGRVWLCPDINFAHHGMKQYKGNFYADCSRKDDQDAKP